MIWTRIETASWTLGLSIDTCLTVHIGPLKISWVFKGSPLYRDFRRIRKQGD